MSSLDSFTEHQPQVACEVQRDRGDAQELVAAAEVEPPTRGRPRPPLKLLEFPMRPSLSAGFPLLLTLLTACPSASTSSDDDDSAAVDEGPIRVDQYLQGTSQITFGEGQPMPASPVLLHRALDPADNSLVEIIYQPNETGEVDRFEVTGVIDAEASTWTFSFYDGYGTFEGSGTLFGEAWLWDSWESRSEYVDGPYVGSYVLSEDRMTETGLEADKQIWSPDDHHEADIVERLDLITAEEWDTAVEKMTGG